MMRILFISPVLLLLLGTSWFAIVLLMARARMRPPRLSAIKALLTLGRATPADLGLKYEALIFPVAFMGKPVGLSAAFVPHPSAKGRLVVLLHGFADSSAGSAAWLPMLQECAVNVLLVDLPGHGESSDSISTAGFHERYAIAQVIAQMRTHHADACRTITLFGISMGAAVALSAACLPDVNVAGVIVDSPYADFRSAAILHARLFGLPGSLFQRPATWLLERWLKLDYAEVAPLNIIAKPPCPVLLIQSGSDVLISADDAAAMRANLESRHDGSSHSLVVAHASHILGLAADPETYSQTVAEFLAAT